MIRLPYEEIAQTLLNILKEYNFSDSKAQLIARVHTESSCDGVYSHGLNRFPLFIDYVERD
jgi:3-dehydro-L-gulonate 2-dehydrogenase